MIVRIVVEIQLAEDGKMAVLQKILLSVLVDLAMFTFRGGRPFVHPFGPKISEVSKMKIGCRSRGV